MQAFSKPSELAPFPRSHWDSHKWHLYPCVCLCTRRRTCQRLCLEQCHKYSWRNAKLEDSRGLVNGDRRIPFGRRCTMENRVIHMKIKWFGNKSMKMRGSWKMQECKSAIGNNGELGKGMPGCTSPKKSNGPGNIPEHSNLPVRISPSYLSRVVFKWLQFWRLRDLPLGHSGSAGLAFVVQYRDNHFVYVF